MTSQLLSFALDEQVAHQLDQLVRTSGRDQSYHLERALAGYLKGEFRLVQAITEGIEDAEAGNLIDLQLVEAKWLRRRG